MRFSAGSARLLPRDRTCVSVVFCNDSPVFLDPPTQFAPMARKVVNRKEKAAEAEAAERLLSAKKKKTSKRKARSAEDVRLRLYWGVFSQSLNNNPLTGFKHTLPMQ